MAWTYVFDLDGTLYDIENGYERRCRARVYEYMRDALGCESVARAEEIWREHFPKHNQTLRALRRAGYDVDADAYWARTRGDPSEFLNPRAETRAMLDAIAASGGRRLVFTNCHERQAREALHALGIEDCFDGVFGAGGMGDEAKPSAGAFERFFHAHDVRDPTRCVFFEDSLKNLRAASSLFGMVTVLIAGETLDEEVRENDVKTSSTHTTETETPTSFVDLVVAGGVLDVDALRRGAARATARARLALGFALDRDS